MSRDSLHSYCYAVFVGSRTWTVCFISVRETSSRVVQVLDEADLDAIVHQHLLIIGDSGHSHLVVSVLNSLVEKRKTKLEWCSVSHNKDLDIRHSRQLSRQNKTHNQEHHHHSEICLLDFSMHISPFPTFSKHDILVETIFLSILEPQLRRERRYDQQRAVAQQTTTTTLMIP